MKKLIVIMFYINIFAGSGTSGNNLGDDSRIVDLRDHNMGIINSGGRVDTTPDALMSIKKKLLVGEVARIGTEDLMILRTMNRYVALDKYSDVELYREIKDFINIEAKRIKNIFGNDSDEIIKEDLELDKIMPYILEDF